MTDEQLRAEFEAWALTKWPGAILSPDQNNCGIVVPERYKHPKLQAAWEAYQAGRAAQQSQDREDAKEAIERLPRYKVGYISDEWGMRQYLGAIRHDDGRFLRVDEVKVAIYYALRRNEEEKK